MISVAILDIGSNAIRAVVYDTSYDPYPLEIYAGKFRVDISELLEEENIDVNHEAYKIVSHLSSLFQRGCARSRKQHRHELVEKRQ